MFVTAPDPLAVIEEALKACAAFAPFADSDDRRAERAFAALAKKDEALLALASLKRERAKNIEAVARLLMAALCPFEGVSGDFDRCSSVTRQIYEEKAATVFGLTLDDYYSAALDEEQERNTNVG